MFETIEGSCLEISVAILSRLNAGKGKAKENDDDDGW
jgi:hypothetical protein